MTLKIILFIVQIILLIAEIGLFISSLILCRKADKLCEKARLLQLKTEALLKRAEALLMKTEALFKKCQELDKKRQELEERKFYMQCESCKLKNECLNCGNKDIKENYFSCTDYDSEIPMPAHTHPLFKSLFSSRNKTMNRSSDDMLCDVDNATRHGD